MKLVKYSAVWCRPCKAFNPVVAEVTERLGLEVEHVDIDEQPTEGIMSVPTVRLYDGEMLLAEHSGAMSKPELEAWIESNR